MVVVQKSFFTVSKHFPTHRPLIELLFQSSPVFRETCMDYHECSKALHYWSNSSSREASFRKQEYSALLQELEQEIVQSLSLQDSDKVVDSCSAPPFQDAVQEKKNI